jgi:hypothetical protein
VQPASQVGPAGTASTAGTASPAGGMTILGLGSYLPETVVGMDFFHAAGMPPDPIIAHPDAGRS